MSRMHSIGPNEVTVQQVTAVRVAEAMQTLIANS